MFWSSDRLKERLPSLVSDFDVRRMDRASYRLRIGPEVYVSPTGEAHDPQNKSKTSLEPNHGFTVPAGQFGFLLTEETVKVPSDALAFISIRSKYKFRGLVNVSGFHVDPGFEGRLVFAIFNAGPGPVHLARGDDCFLIWFASIDAPSGDPPKPGYTTLPSTLTGPIAGGLESFALLHSKISDNKKEADERLRAVEREQVGVRTLLAVLVTLCAAIAVKAFVADSPHSNPNIEHAAIPK